MPKPHLILVTGPPGSGKTTLAARLAAEVGCPLVSRDAIKEGMAHAAPGYVPAVTDQMALRTYGVFFEVIALLVRAETTLVAEAAFQHAWWRRGLDPLLGLAELRVVRCRVDPATRRRPDPPAAGRAAGPGRARRRGAPRHRPALRAADPGRADPRRGHRGRLPAGPGRAGRLRRGAMSG